jgi:hypothetical protein
MAKTTQFTDLMTMIAASMSGLLIAALAVILAGGGHGWTGALWSGFAVVTIPLGALAWRYRDVGAGRTIARAIVAMDVLVDAALFLAMLDDDFRTAWRHLAPIVLIWAALWIGWQVPPMIAALPRKR